MANTVLEKLVKRIFILYQLLLSLYHLKNNLLFLTPILVADTIKIAVSILVNDDDASESGKGIKRNIIDTNMIMAMAMIHNIVKDLK